MKQPVLALLSSLVLGTSVYAQEYDHITGRITLHYHDKTDTEQVSYLRRIGTNTLRKGNRGTYCFKKSLDENVSSENSFYSSSECKDGNTFRGYEVTVPSSSVRITAFDVDSNQFAGPPDFMFIQIAGFPSGLGRLYRFTDEGVVIYPTVSTGGMIASSIESLSRTASDPSYLESSSFYSDQLDSASLKRAREASFTRDYSTLKMLEDRITQPRYTPESPYRD